MSNELTRNHLTLAEIKERFNIPPTTLKSRIERKKFKSAIKKGKTWFINENEIIKFVENEYKSKNKKSA